MKRKHSLSKIYTTFFIVSLCTFGGGYAMLPMLEHEIVEKRGWLSREVLIDLFAVAQSLPGIIGINIACLITSTIFRKDKGNEGGAVNVGKEGGAVDAGNEGGAKAPVIPAIVAVLGVMTPCVVIILIVAILLTSFRENEVVQHALSGVSICVLALILNTIIKMWKSSIKSIPQIVLFAGAFAISLLTNISPVFTILGGGVIGAVLGAVAGRKANRETRLNENLESSRKANREDRSKS